MNCTALYRRLMICYMINTAVQFMSVYDSVVGLLHHCTKNVCITLP